MRLTSPAMLSALHEVGVIPHEADHAKDLTIRVSPRGEVFVDVAIPVPFDKLVKALLIATTDTSA